MPTYDADGALLISLAGVVLDHEHSAPGDGGPLAVGVTDTDLTAGSVWFAGAGGLLQEDNVNLFWNDASNRLGIGTNVPSTNVNISENNADIEPAFRVEQNSTGDASIRLRIAGATSWSFGIDNSDGDKYKWAPSASVGVGTVGTLTTTGDWGFGTEVPNRRIHAADDSASAVVIIPIARLESQVDGGAGAAGHGPGLDLYGETTTTENQPMGQVAATWQTPTHASRRAQLRFFADLQGTLYPVGVIVGPNTAPAVPAVAAWGIGAVDFQTSRINATDVASGLNSTISGGHAHVVSSQYGVVAGGAINQVSANYGMIPGGLYGFADKYGQLAHGAGRFSADGDAQRSAFVARRDRATHAVNTWYSLWLDGAAAQMTIAASSAWTFRALVVGLTANAAQQFSYEVVGLIERDNAGNTTLAASTTTTIFESDANYDCQAIADNVNEALEIQVRRTGGVDYSVQWVAAIHTVECIHT